MPSIKIHSNIYGFEKKRKGFTQRQIAGFAIGVALAVGSAALFGFVLGLPYELVSIIAFALLAIPVLCGFMPIEGMPAEEFATRVLALDKRGNALHIEGEHVTDEIQKGEVSRAYAKASKAKGAEISGNADGR